MTELTPFFLDSQRGPLFCLYTAPTDVEPRGAVLYIHPFAEEMHKSRRMAALQTRAFAAEGYAVLQVDLTGCGDSAGDFGDASWHAWQDDAQLAYAWLCTKANMPMMLWGLRTGATLAAEMATKLPAIQGLLLWQPVLSGDQFINQLLRIKLASEMLADGQARSGTKALRAQLEQGQGVEVGGNMLSPDLAHELGKIKLLDITPTCPVSWLEIGMEAGDLLPPASQRVVEAWRTKGVEVASEMLQGEPFWVTQEITECPLLVEATTQSMLHPSA